MPQYTHFGVDGKVTDMDQSDVDAFFQKSGSTRKGAYTRKQMAKELKIVLERLNAAEGVLNGIAGKVARSSEISNSEVREIKALSNNLSGRIKNAQKQLKTYTH